jgi:hypothetical protein
MNNNFLPYQIKKNAEQNNVLATQLAQITQQINGVVNVNQYSISPNTGQGVGAAFNSMISTLRTNVINNSLTQFYTVEIPSGKYIIDQQINVSPYIKFKSLGLVIFEVTFNGSAFYIAPQSGDPTYPSTPYYLSKNAWNRGDYFDGSNGGFVFETTLNISTNSPIAIELGSRNNASSSNTPIARYTISNVNVFGMDTAFKFNAVNNYIGTFKNCHIEGNNHAVWVTNPTAGTNTNSGENFVFDNCIIANHLKEAFYIQVPGHDFSFENCSFDFNASPVFHSTDSGTSLRFNNSYCEMIGNGTTDNQYFYQADVTLAGEVGGRNTFYAKNLIFYLKRPAQMFLNNAYSGGGYINMYVDLDGVELRYNVTDLTDNYTLANLYLTDTTTNTYLLRHRVLNTSIVKSLVGKSVNLLSNGDFEQSTLSTVLTTNGADPYWYVSFVSNVTNPTIVQEGNGGSLCAKYTVNTAGNNSAKFQNNFYYNADAGDLIKFNCLLKLDKVVSTDQIIYRLECYDQNNALITTLNYYDSTTTNSTLTTVDNTQFRRNRGFGTFFLPAKTVKIKPYVIINNMSATTVWVDEIHLSKAR